MVAMFDENVREMVLKVGAALPKLVFNVGELVAGNTIFGIA